MNYVVLINEAGSVKTETVEAVSYDYDEHFLTFRDHNRKKIASIRTSMVRSVRLGEVEQK